MTFYMRLNKNAKFKTVQSDLLQTLKKTENIVAKLQMLRKNILFQFCYIFYNHLLQRVVSTESGSFTSARTIVQLYQDNKDLGQVGFVEEREMMMMLKRGR